MSQLRRLTASAKERLPEPLVSAASRAATTWGSTTASARMLPSFLVVGAQRCGTTTLYRLLSEHPQVVRPIAAKGIGFFDLNHDRGMRWYRGHFPVERLARARNGPGAVTFESSGYYCFHPAAAQRIRTDLPGVRVVMMVRDPVERAWSAYKHERARGFESLSFSEALSAEPDRLRGEEDRLLADPRYRSEHHRHHAYLGRGRYAEQVERLRDELGGGSVLVVDADRFFAEPVAEFDRITDWLGLARSSPEAVKQWNARPGDLDPGIRSELEAYFEPHDRRLAELVGWTPSWRDGVAQGEPC